jgi:hypothetical protein
MRCGSNGQVVMALSRAIYRVENGAELPRFFFVGCRSSFQLTSFCESDDAFWSFFEDDMIRREWV